MNKFSLFLFKMLTCHVVWFNNNKVILEDD